MPLHFSHVQLYVRDFSRAMTWYQEILGFHPAGHVADGEYAELLQPEMDLTISLHILRDPGASLAYGPMPYLATDALDQTIANLRAKGVKVPDPHREGGSPRFTGFEDSEGNSWGLVETS